MFYKIKLIIIQLTEKYENKLFVTIYDELKLFGYLLVWTLLMDLKSDHCVKPFIKLKNQHYYSVKKVTLFGLFQSPLCKKITLNSVHSTTLQ